MLTLILLASIGADIGAPIPFPGAPIPLPAAPVVAPLADTPPRPVGEGWQFDPVMNHWWRFAPVQQSTPAWGLPAPVSPYRSNPFQYWGLTAPAAGNCPNGQCPKR